MRLLPSFNFNSKILGSSSVTLLAALCLCNAIITLGSPRTHSLLVHAVSWGFVWLCSVFHKYERVGNGGNRGRKQCWAAGGLLVLAQICDRVAGGRKGTWWIRAISPCALVAIRWFGRDDCKSQSNLLISPLDKERLPKPSSKILLAIVTVSSAIALSPPYIGSSAFALCLCNILLNALAYTLLEDVINLSNSEIYNSSNGHVTPNGWSLAQQLHSPTNSTHLVSRNLSASIAIGCAVASILLENHGVDGLTYRRELSFVGDSWKRDMRQFAFGKGFSMCLVGTVNGYLTIYAIERRGALTLTLVELGAALCIHLAVASTTLRTLFTLLSFAAILSFYQPISASYGGSVLRKRMKAKQLISLLALLSFGSLSIILWCQPKFASRTGLGRASSLQRETHTEPSKPLPATELQSHPISQLVAEAEAQFMELQTRQSKTLTEAVTEYRRRYNIPPPPNFDIWYEFAKARGIQLVDEYDTIFDSLLPFWALEPSVIRARTREALGFDNALIGLLIRAGEAVKIENGADWQQKATVGMIEKFVQYLPDMDVAFNIHDEPRVMVPHDDLARLVTRAKYNALPAAFKNQSPRNKWSDRPKDMTNGRHISEVSTTRFNTFAHQPTWTNSRLSCSPDSPARALDENTADNITAYALGDLGFIYNKTAFSDICLSPSLRETYGFFDRPNAFSIVHDLFPIFSQSKLSSFQDILYPSPWYWYGKVRYHESADVPWPSKNDALYWRGSTTGGFSRDGGWRRQHRQRCVQKLNALDTATVLVRPTTTPNAGWQARAVKKTDYKALVDVAFSHIGQCDDGDCDAQREFFAVAAPAAQDAAWANKLLLDVDGNAFSGRFYAFLKSWSLVVKLAIFREWHEEWLRPWLHYVPLSFKGDEYVEAVRFFLQEEEGKVLAERVARAGREWAGKVLRKEDLEVWFFRLLLEYGRLVDDDRAIIGYAGP